MMPVGDEPKSNVVKLSDMIEEHTNRQVASRKLFSERLSCHPELSEKAVIVMKLLQKYADYFIKGTEHGLYTNEGNIDRVLENMDIIRTKIEQMLKD